VRVVVGIQEFIEQEETEGTEEEQQNRRAGEQKKYALS
jgi:hypothetical protein